MDDVRRLPDGEDNGIAVTLDDLAREVALRAPRVNDERVDGESGERRRFWSRILPAYARRLPKVNDVLPVLHLRGLSTGDFRPALELLLGEDASGLSSSAISRLCKDWEAEHARFRMRSLRLHRYAYLFVDGVHVSVRWGEDDRLCLLVVIGVREDGVKELLAVEDGYRESTESWAAVMRDLKGAPAQRARARDRRRRARHVGRAQRRVPRGAQADVLGERGAQATLLDYLSSSRPRRGRRRSPGCAACAGSTRFRRSGCAPRSVTLSASSAPAG